MPTAAQCASSLPAGPARSCTTRPDTSETSPPSLTSRDKIRAILFAAKRARDGKSPTMTALSTDEAVRPASWAKSFSAARRACLFARCAPGKRMLRYRSHSKYRVHAVWAFVASGGGPDGDPDPVSPPDEHPANAQDITSPRRRARRRGLSTRSIRVMLPQASEPVGQLFDRRVSHECLNHRQCSKTLANFQLPSRRASTLACGTCTQAATQITSMLLA